MLGNMVSLEEIDYNQNPRSRWRGSFSRSYLSKCDLVSIVELDHDSQRRHPSCLQIVDKILPNLPPRDSRLFFFDLTDPAKSSRESLLEVLQVISRFQGYAETCLGLNFNEALQVCETLGLSKGDKSEESLKKMASDIRRKLEISCVVTHPVDSAAYSYRRLMVDRRAFY